MASSRRDMEFLTDSVREYCTTHVVVLYQCRLDTKYIAVDADIVPDQPFLWTVKFQNGECHNLTPYAKVTELDLQVCTNRPSQFTETLAKGSRGAVDRTSCVEGWLNRTVSAVLFVEISRVLLTVF